MKSLSYLSCETRTIALKLLTEWPKTREDELAFHTVRTFFLQLLHGNADEVMKIRGIDTVSNWTLEYMDTIAVDAVKMKLPCCHNHEQELQALWLNSGNPPYNTLRPVLKCLPDLSCETRTVALKLFTEWPRTRKDELAFDTVRTFFLQLLRRNSNKVMKTRGIDTVANWTLEYMDTIAEDAAKMELPCSHNHGQELLAFWLESGNPPYDTLRPIRYFGSASN